MARLLGHSLSKLVSAATLATAIDVGTSGSQQRTGCRSTLSAHSAADACAQRSAACHRANCPCAPFEVTPGRAAIKRIEARAACADGRALLSTEQRANGCPSADDGDGACLSPEARTSSSILPEGLWNYCRQEQYQAEQRRSYSLHNFKILRLVLVLMAYGRVFRSTIGASAIPHTLLT
jgi:hypothetical protein